MSYPKVLFKIMSFEENIEVITDFFFVNLKIKIKKTQSILKIILPKLVIMIFPN